MYTGKTNSNRCGTLLQLKNDRSSKNFLQFVFSLTRMKRSSSAFPRILSYIELLPSVSSALLHRYSVELFQFENEFLEKSMDFSRSSTTASLVFLTIFQFE